MKRIVIIEGDTNDADYTTREEILNEKDIELLKKICDALKNTKNIDYCNWGIGEYCDEEECPHVVYKNILTEEEIEEFNENYCPYDIHSIESIRVLTISEEEVLF